MLAVFGGFKQHLPTPKALPDEELAKVRTRILLLLGSNSVIADPAAVAEQASRAFPDVEVEIVPVPAMAPSSSPTSRAAHPSVRRCDAGDDPDVRSWLGLVHGLDLDQTDLSVIASRNSARRCR